MTTYLTGLRLLHRDALLYLGAVALVGFAVDGGVYAVLFNLYLIRMDYGSEAIGAFGALGTLTFALSSLPAGMLGERYGVRRMLLLGLLLMLVCGALLPLADRFEPFWWAPWLVVTTVGLYIGLALYFVNTAPFIMGIVTPEQRNSIFSTQMALLSLAGFAGSLFGGFLPKVFATSLGRTLEEPLPYSYPLIIAALAMLPALFAIRSTRSVVIAPTPPPTETDLSRPITAPVLAASAVTGIIVVMALVRLLQVSGLAAANTFFNVYLDRALQVPTDEIGLLTGVGRLLAAPASLITPLLVARYGNRHTVIYASLGAAVSILPLALIPHWAAAGLSFVGVVGLSSIRYASSLVYFLELVPEERRATVSGATEMAAGLSFALMTFSGGYIIARFGYQNLFLLGAGLTALGALAFWLCFRDKAKKA